MVAKRLMVLLGSRQRSARDRCGRLAAVSLCQPIVKRILTALYDTFMPVARHPGDGQPPPRGMVFQGIERRNEATPDMNICTDKAISSMPITRSSAVSTLSPSQRNR